MIVLAMAAVLIPSGLSFAAKVAVAPEPGEPGGLVDRSATLPADRTAGGDPVRNLTTNLTYPTIEDAVTAASDLDILQVEASLTEGILNVNKQVVIQGLSGTEIITAGENTGTSGDSRGWFLVTVPNVTFRDLNFDGDSENGRSIYQIIRTTAAAAGAVVDNCSFADATGLPLSSYDGRGVVAQANVTVTDCSFTNIRRIGIFLFGTATEAVISGNVYTGKGLGDHLDYGIEIGGGAVATLTANTITDCRGEASDGSTSAGVLITTFFALGTSGTLMNNIITGNTGAIVSGFNNLDESTTVAHDNDLSGNDDYGVQNTSDTKTVDASANWWGTNDPVGVGASVTGDPIDYTPWLDTGTDTSISPGFQGDFSWLHVDDNSPQTGATGRVQEGVDLVTASTVELEAGTYEEQVVIDGKDVELVGSGRSNTFIQSPVTLATIFVTPSENKPVVTAMNADDVRIQDLTVDGLGRGNGNVRMEGIAFWNAGGKVIDCDVVNITETPLSGVQHGVAVWCFNDTGGPYSLEIGRVNMSNFQKNGTSLSGEGMVVDVHDCVVTGAGDSPLIAQNGIQVSFGAGGAITRCTVSDMRYTPATFVSSGILTFEATGGVAVSELVVPDGVQAPVSWLDSAGSMDQMDITGGDFEAVFIYNSTQSAKVEEVGRKHPSVAAFSEGRSSAAKSLADFDVTVTNSCLTGREEPETIGLSAYSEGGQLKVDGRFNRITDYDTGILVTRTSTTVNMNGSSIAGNETAGWDNSLSGALQNAEFNWWGDASGPSGVGPGTGDAIIGTGVDFDPWTSSGDSPTVCAFTGTGVEEPEMAAGLPLHLELLGSQPNPFNPSTTIRFRLPEAERVTLNIYNVAGKLIRTLVAGPLEAGEHAAFWDGRSNAGRTVGSGVYVLRLRAGDKEMNRKIQLLK